MKKKIKKLVEIKKELTTMYFPRFAVVKRLYCLTETIDLQAVSRSIIYTFNTFNN